MWCLWCALQVPRNLIWQFWRGVGPDITWRLSGLPLVYHAGGNNPFTRFIFKKLGRTSTISIGRNFSALSIPTHNAIGVIQRTLLRTAGYGAMLKIGNNVGVSGASICAVQSVTIGNNVLIGSGVIIMDSDFHPVDPQERLNCARPVSRPVVIGDNVFIGARAIILKGVVIGDNSTVGAGAVVSQSIPPNTVVAGNPAHVVKEFHVKKALKGGCV